MDATKITREGIVTDRETGKELGRVYRGHWTENTGDGTGREVSVWKAEDVYGRRGSAWPRYFASRAAAVDFLAGQA